MMVQVIPFALAVLAGLIAGFVIGQLRNPRRKATKQEKVRWLYIHTEDLSYFGKCEIVEGGVRPVGSDDLAKDWVVTDGMIQRQVRMDDYQTLYVVLSERVALLNHRDLDRLRQGMLVRSMPAVRPGGDTLNVMKFVATALPLLLSVYIAYQMFSFQGIVQALNAQVILLEDTLEKGVPIRRE